MADIERLEAARRMAMEVAREFPASRRIGRTGRHTMRVPVEAFYNAIEANGGVGADGKTVWDDPEYSRDMQRYYPECAVGDADAGRKVFAMRRPSARMRNRFGRVTYRKVYP